MKKAKIIVPAIALLALGVAGSTLGTVAWFQADQTVNVTATSVQQGAMSAKVTDASVGTFTFTLSGLTATTADKSVDLTDAEGKSWVYIDATSLQEVTPSNPTCEWSGLSFAVSYSGPSDTAAKIQAEWNNVCTQYSTVSVAVSSDTGNTHVVRFGAAGAGAAACVNGPYSLLSAKALNSISWSSAPTGSAAPYSSSQSIALTASAFATALTGLTSNEGAVAAGTHGITVAITLA